MNNILYKLSQSTFRTSFKLRNIDIEYINKKGLDKIREYAYQFVDKRLNKPINDGKQTPMKGHPVFIAQHATATCCRNCLCKWHKIPKNAELTQLEKDYIVNVIMEWIENELNKN